LQNSLNDDGIWFENSLGNFFIVFLCFKSLAYHYYALQAVVKHIRFAKQAGILLYENKANKKSGTGSKTIESMFSS
jgi:hypothetical protein